jgi:ribosomal protein S18 acetylase RimI-like enzyme
LAVTEHVTWIRDAVPGEATVLVALQRRSSGVWEEFREHLTAHPDAIELPEAFIANGWVRVAVGDGGTPVGFSVVIPRDDGAHELDGLFVEPDCLRRGIGRTLVDDAVARARARSARRLEVTAGPAQGFYEKLGFIVVGSVQTRFAPAVRMHRALHGSQPRDLRPARTAVPASARRSAG